MVVRRLASVGAALAALLLAGASGAVDTPPSSDLPDLSTIRAQIYSGDYEPAAEALLELSEEVRHADVYNLLGFSLRNLGRYEEAGRWYREALYYDPTHRPAIEYQGELFIATGELDRARENVDILRLLCPNGCRELDILTQAVAEAESAAEAAHAH